MVFVFCNNNKKHNKFNNRSSSKATCTPRSPLCHSFSQFYVLQISMLPCCHVLCFANNSVFMHNLSTVNHHMLFKVSWPHNWAKLIALLHQTNDSFVSYTSENTVKTWVEMVVCLQMLCSCFSKRVKAHSWVQSLTFSWVAEFPNCHEESFFYAVIQASFAWFYKSQGPIMKRVTLWRLHITH